MKRICCLTVVLLMLSLSPAVAKDFEIITGEWAPYVSKTMKDGGPTAIIVAKALEAVGHKAVFKFDTWKRTEILTQKGKAVATFPWTATDGFKQTCSLSTPIATQKMVFFYMKEN